MLEATKAKIWPVKYIHLYFSPAVGSDSVVVGSLLLFPFNTLSALILFGIMQDAFLLTTKNIQNFPAQCKI